MTAVRPLRIPERYDPAEADKLALYVCPSGHRTLAFLLDGIPRELPLTCRSAASASARCGALATWADSGLYIDDSDFPVAVVISERGRKVEWLHVRSRRLAR